MKHYAMQTNMTLGYYSTRSKRRPNPVRTTRAAKAAMAKQVSDEMAEWALKTEPMLAFTVMVGQQ